MTESSSPDPRVAAAFDRARQGDFEPVSKLAEIGSAVIPQLAPYVQDKDEMVRVQAVSLLSTFDDPRVLPLLRQALLDPLQDIRGRAALALYERFDPNALAQDAETGKALRASVDAGNDAAAAILLLAYFPETASTTALTRLRERSGASLTELQSWTPVVRLSLAADLALSRLGDSDAEQNLLERIAAGELQELLFMLGVLREIDSPRVAHALAKASLGDEREVAGGLPSGAGPKRRLCDVAVVNLSRRFGLKPGFALDEQRRYSPEEIAAVQNSLRASLPR